MASQADAENALVDLAATAIYPDGTASLPVIAAEARIYRGWPNATALEQDLAAGLVNVSVFASPHATVDTTRYMQQWMAASVAPFLTASAAGNTATFAGVASAGQIAGILVDGQSFVHRTIAGDTVELVAASLGALIRASRPATVAASTVTVPDALSLVARTGADASANIEMRRQRQEFRISAWCPTPDLRDSACDVLDAAMASTPFLTLADGSAARLRFSSTTSFDGRQDAALYRRDLLYTVEFPTTQTVVQPSMLFGTLRLGPTTITA